MTVGNLQKLHSYFYTPTRVSIWGSKIQRFLHERNIFSKSLDAGRTAGHRTSQCAWCCGGGVFGVSVEMHMMAKRPIDPSLETLEGNKCDCRVLNFVIWFRSIWACHCFFSFACFAMRLAGPKTAACHTAFAGDICSDARPWSSGLLLVDVRYDLVSQFLVWKAMKRNSVWKMQKCKFPWTILGGGQWVLDPCAVEESLGASVSLCFLDGRWLVFHQAPILGQMLFLKSSRYSRFKL